MLMHRMIFQKFVTNFNRAVNERHYRFGLWDIMSIWRYTPYTFEFFQDDPHTLISNKTIT